MLEISALRAGYGAINVLWDLTLTIEAGKLTAIVGPNGAGKSTLLRTIMGLLPTTAGSILLDGQALHTRPAWSRAEAGLSMAPEGRLLFADMSVQDNLLLGAFPKSQRALAGERLEQAYQLFPRLKERRRQLAGSLSGGEAQMLAMARALMPGPRLLIVDEPSLGLAPLVADQLFEVLAGLKAQGRTIVLVEQHTQRALELADRLVLMQGGSVVLSQPAAGLTLAQLHGRYFGQ